MKFQFTNRASTTLAAPLAVDGTYITVAPGTGDRFPRDHAGRAVPGQHRQRHRRIRDRALQQPGRRRADIVRGQEGTSVSSFAEGSLVELRLTAEVLNSFLPRAAAR